MPFKVTILFTQATGAGGGGVGIETRVAGWSESIWSIQTTIQDVLDRLYTAGAWGLGLCVRRAQFLPEGGQIIGQRIAAYNTQLQRLGKAQTFRRFFPGLSYPTDLPNMAVSCSVPSASSLNVRKFSLRDIPDNQVTFGEYTPDFGFAAQVNGYLAELSAWEFVGQNFSVAPNAAVSVTGTGDWTTILPINLNVGDIVQFSKVNLTGIGKKVGGKVVCTVPSNGGNTFSTTWPFGIPGTLGTVRKVTYQLFTMNGVGAIPDKAVSRKVGRPFDLFHGRRSKRLAI